MIDLAQLRVELAAAGDPAKALQQQRYMKSAFRTPGSPPPSSTRSCAPPPAIAPDDREQWQDTVRTCWDGVVHREEWYAAIDLARHRQRAPGRTATSTSGGT